MAGPKKPNRPARAAGGKQSVGEAAFAKSATLGSGRRAPEHGGGLSVLASCASRRKRRHFGEDLTG